MANEVLENLFPKEVQNELTLEFLTDLKNRYLEINNMTMEFFVDVHKGGFHRLNRDNALVWVCQKHIEKIPHFDKWRPDDWMDSDAVFAALCILLEKRERERVNGNEN